MKHVEDDFDNSNFDEGDISWMDALDAIAIDGQSYAIESKFVVSQDDEEQELLRLAAQLSVTLAPLRELNASDRAQKQRLKMRLKAALEQKVRRHWWYRKVVVAAAILMFLLLGPGVLLEINLAGHWNRGGIGVNEPGRLSATGTPVASPNTFVLNPTQSPAPTPQSHITPTLHGKVKVLLPPDNLSGAVEVDVPFIQQTGGVLYRYFAHYIVAGQDVFLYEDLGSPPKYPMAFNGLHLVSIGAVKGWLDQDTAGRNILNWFQDGFYCQITSTLPINQLADFASHFQVVSTT